MRKSSGVPKNSDLSLLPGEQFLNLSNLFIEYNYPYCIKLNLISDSFVLNALAYSESVVITPLKAPDSTLLKKRVSKDIKTLLNLKYPPINLIYLIDGALSLSENDMKLLNSSLSRNGYRVFIHSEKRIYESLLLSYKAPPGTQESLKEVYEMLHNAEQVEESIIEEIFSLIYSDNKEKIEISPMETKLLSLKSKIYKNFIGDNYREVLNTYDIFWVNKECVEAFIKKNFRFYEEQLYTILSKIRNNFKKHHLNFKGIVDFAVNDPKYFDELIPLILQAEKIGDPRYENAAKAIILFFFEYCDFGKKSKDDPQTLFTKFDIES